MKKYLTTLSIALILIGCNNSANVQQDGNSLAVTKIGDRNISIDTTFDKNTEGYIYLKNISTTRDTSSDYLIGFKVKNKLKPNIEINSNVKGGQYKVIAMIKQADGSYKELDSRVIKIDNIKKSFDIKNIKLDDVYIVNSQSKDNFISTQFYINTNYNTTVTIKAKLNINGQDYNLKFVDDTKLLDSISNKLTPDTTNGLYVALKLDNNDRDEISNILAPNDIKDGTITFYISDKYKTIKKDKKISFYKKSNEKKIVIPNTRFLNSYAEYANSLENECTRETVNVAVGLVIKVKEGESYVDTNLMDCSKYKCTPLFQGIPLPITSVSKEDCFSMVQDYRTKAEELEKEYQAQEEINKVDKELMNSPKFVDIGGNKNWPIGNDDININVSTDYSSSVNLAIAKADSNANFDVNVYGHHFSLLSGNIGGIITYSSFDETKINANLKIVGINVLNYSKSVSELATYKKPQKAELTEEEKKLSIEQQAYILRARQIKNNEEAPEKSYLSYDQDFSKTIEVKPFSYQLVLLGYPVIVMIAPGGSMGVNTNIGLTGITRGDISISPYGSANVDASVGVGCELASAGIEGNFEILKDTVNAKGTLAFTFVAKDNALYLRGNVIGDLSNTLTGPNGTLSLYGKAGFLKASIPFFDFSSRKFTQTIFHDEKTFVEHKLGDL